MVRQTSSLKYSSSLLNSEQDSSHFLVKIIGRCVKRAFDILSALSGLLILSPLFGFITYKVKHDSPGPVFYWGSRAGLGGKAFRILKFRTMYECPDSYMGPKVTCKEDSRITPFGHWLRNTK